jgi:integrase
MSWIEKLDSGRYRGVYRDELGRRRSATFPRRAQATAWLAAERTDRSRGHWVDPREGALLLSAWAHQWFAVRTVRPTTAASDRSRYLTHLEPALGDFALRDLTPLRVKSLVADLSTRRSAGTVRHVHALLSSMLADAVHEGLLLASPCGRTKLPRATPPHATFLSPNQIATLAAAIDPRYRTLVLAAAGTGMRWGELAGLSRDALDLLHGRLFIERTLIEVNGTLSFGAPKSRTSRRVVTLSPGLVKVLDDHLTGHRSELVFTAPSGEPLSRHNFNNRVWQPAVRKADFQPAPRFHDIRHSHVAMLIASGVPVKAIQERLGHASIVMTMDRYGHLLPSVDTALLKAVDDGLGAILLAGARAEPADDRR